MHIHNLGRVRPNCGVTALAPIDPSDLLPQMRIMMLLLMLFVGVSSTLDSAFPDHMHVWNPSKCVAR